MSKTNLTGGQVETVLDTLLNDCLSEVVEATSAFDIQLAYLITLITSNKKRKPYSAESRERAISLIVKAMSSPREEKMLYIKELKIERSFVYMFLERFVDRYYEPYILLYRRFIGTTDPEIRRKCARQLDVYVSLFEAQSRSSLFVCLNNVRELLPHFKQYFHSVVEDFHRLCVQQAKFYIDTNKGKHYDQKDAQQNFLRNVIVAINKYDSSRGALASYIKWWILNAQTCNSADHEYGIAYTIPQTQRKKLASKEDSFVNFSVSLDQPQDDSGGEGEGAIDFHSKVSDDRNLDEMVDGQRRAEALGLLIKRVDPMGIARLTLDVKEYFTPQEQERMLQHMRKQENDRKVLQSPTSNSSTRVKRKGNTDTRSKQN